MKNNIRLHFGQAIAVLPEAVGKPKDSGNGYYSYSYYLLPYTGTLTSKALAAVHAHLSDKHYRPPFVSFRDAESFGSQNENNGLLLVSTIYHHGD